MKVVIVEQLARFSLGAKAISMCGTVSEPVNHTEKNAFLLY